MHHNDLILALTNHYNWQSRALYFFLQSEKASISLMTLFRVTSEILQLLSLFLPLKIILILTAGHTTFRLFGEIDAARINSWIIFLTAAVIISYFLSIALNFLANRINARTSTRLIESLNAKQDNDELKEEKLRSIFYQLFIGYSELVLLIISWLLLFWIDPFVSTVATIGLATELLLAAVIMRTESGITGLIASAIKRNPSGFIHYLFALNFILFFLALIFEHVYIGNLNAVIAIFSLLLARKFFQLARSFASRTLKLELSSDTEYLSDALRV